MIARKHSLRFLAVAGIAMFAPTSCSAPSSGATGTEIGSLAKASQ